MFPSCSDLERLARQAGEILRNGYEREHQIRYKGVIDLVTEVDSQSEAFLLSEIQKRFDGHSILSEESGEIDGREDHLWYLDPLDGTVNYAHGVPIFSVSIAYAHRGSLLLGAVYDPLREEMFLAERGQGAWLNGRSIHVSSTQELRHSLLVTGFPYDAWETEQDNFEYFVRFAKRTQGVRRLGSAALDLCYVAAGRFDGYWELSLKPWDAAAGALIAEEAGAKVTRADGASDYLQPPISILAAPPTLHEQILTILQQPRRHAFDTLIPGS